ncbi:bifunctional isocitrate dehydrogenase kinase/phosphatase [Aquiflexum gelatinilyticum]|uniref:Bifunctional isocitrate dehydrogenase kinase/phosphatase n=1 Tax=Aquiflexum gelatinilyticum TaxID=2961943 RepID=A0A9X2P4R4_9BACT|nr:bifunctional isocitrate dehydrogenase kinase/phosphatase [Aquiflexum gelatinilyticum]MCR9014791.1 bifunctional isocitrate dehydrogenase kinase/phosphatase [Aquiflexum gelatinilyticum]
MSEQLIGKTAQFLLAGFETYIRDFNELTDLTPIFFKIRDWKALQQNHRKRLRLYKDQVNTTRQNLNEILLENTNSFDFWKTAKAHYSLLISNKKDKELAETYFNSVIRKSYSGLVINEDLMFVHEGYNSCAIYPNDNLYHSYPSDWGLDRIIQKILEDFDFGVPYMNKEEDIKFLIKSVKDVILTRYIPTSDSTTQVLKSVFYRNKGAYVIGRIRFGGKWMPFIIPFLNGPKGVFADTMIFDPNLMSGLFSFSRSYFMVKTDIPSQMISFLNAVIPNKKIHELYNAIGFNKHGKTEFYRDFLNHLSQSQDNFVLSEGVKGMVMTVFTLPSYNVVFKMIKDYFDPPKTMTRQEVREKYKMVGLHDRVGRMADTHEFEEFHLPLNRIDPLLLEELRSTVNSLLYTTSDELILRHVYIERRMTPLNIYLDTCSTEDAKQAVEEYGNSILEMAKANIFPGDMMTKNFGVTRQKRVIFYDYDEIEFLTDMNFREKPKPETFEQIYASTPWYNIAPNDVFPQDFKRFMIGRKDVKNYFFDYHTDLFNPENWKKIQEKIISGSGIHAFSYPQKIRFRPDEEI